MLKREMNEMLTMEHWKFSMTYLLECANQVNVTKRLAKSVFQ